MIKITLAIIVITAMGLTVLGQENPLPGAYPGFTITAELDTFWIGEEGFIKTDSTRFDRSAWNHWYTVFSQYDYSAAAFTIVKNSVLIREYRDNSRPTMTDLNDYPRLICDYLLNVDFNTEVYWGEIRLYDMQD